METQISDPTKVGIHPDRVDAKCANCGGNMTHDRRVGSTVLLSCEECPTNGNVNENRLQMIGSHSGTVLLVPTSEAAAEAYTEVLSDDALTHSASPVAE